MNRERTERIITQILRQPERFEMASYVGPGHIYEPEDENDPDGPAHQVGVDVCGTTCCIAGWAVVNDWTDDLVDLAPEPVLAHHWAVEKAVEAVDTYAIHWSDEARALLELPDSPFSPPLFFWPEWPYLYKALADDASEAVAAASLLRDMLDGNVRLTAEEREDARVDDSSWGEQCAWWAQFATNTTLEV